MEPRIPPVALLTKSGEAFRREQERDASSIGCSVLALNLFLLGTAAIFMTRGDMTPPFIIMKIGIVAGLCEIPCAIWLVRLIPKWLRTTERHPFADLAMNANGVFARFNRGAENSSAYADSVSLGLIQPSEVENALILNMAKRGKLLQGYAEHLERLFDQENIPPVMISRIKAEHAQILHGISTSSETNLQKLEDDLMRAAALFPNG
jgi:hypothetical protein